MKTKPDAAAILCADQADNRIRLFNPFAADERKPTLWAYPRDDEPAIRHKPTDAKRVEVDGETHILAAYHGRVRLVRYRDQHLVHDFPSYGSCHSAERLPGGELVSANSNDGMLRLHRSADVHDDLELPYAHGVTWDKARGCLWALGDLLYRLEYAGGGLSIAEKFEIPISPTGHDLFPLRTGAKLLVSNNEALFVFDIESSKFEVVSKLKGIKSASQHLDGTLWASDPSDLAGAPNWQSDSVIRVQPAAPRIAYSNKGARFYKARWWQRVTFSH